MGRWDDDRDKRGFRYGRPTKGRLSDPRLIRRIIFAGFAILGIVMLAFFIPRAGLHIDIHERSEAIGTVMTVTAQVSNNSLDTLRGVTVQFGDDGPVQQIGDMGPFSGVLVSPAGDNFDFDKVTVTANDGAVTAVKYR